MIDERPLPAVEANTQPFWDAVEHHRLVLARCEGCGALSHPPDLSCSQCGSTDRSWVEASGRGTLWSWTICHPPMLPWFAQHGTWLVAVVELEEGPRMVANLRDVEVEDLAFDLPLQATFVKHGDVTLVAFETRGTDV